MSWSNLKDLLTWNLGFFTVLYFRNLTDFCFLPQCEDFKMSGKEYKWSCSKDLNVGSVCLLECKYKQNDNNQVDGLQVKCNEEENWMVIPNYKDLNNWLINSNEWS